MKLQSSSAESAEQRHSHPSLTHIWIAAITGFVGFVAIAFAVNNGLTDNADRLVLLALRDPADLSDAWGPAWFEESAAEISALGGFAILPIFAFLVMITLCLLAKRAAAVYLFVALVGGTALSNGLKFLFARARPDLVDHLDRTFTSSFPSGHAMFGMIAYLTLAAVAIRFIPMHRVRVFIACAAFAVAILIGATRVYLGVHWPSDVLAGWCLGLTWSLLCWLGAHYISEMRAAQQALGHSRT